LRLERKLAYERNHAVFPGQAEGLSPEPSTGALAKKPTGGHTIAATGKRGPQRFSAIAAAPNIKRLPSASLQPNGSDSTSTPAATATAGLMNA